MKTGIEKWPSDKTREEIENKLQAYQHRWNESCFIRSDVESLITALRRALLTLDNIEILDDHAECLCDIARILGCEAQQKKAVREWEPPV